MKYYTTDNGKLLRSKKDELTSLDRAILEKCKIGMNIVRVLKAGKPYYNQRGERRFATTDEILAAVSKLQGLKLLERRWYG